ncbi:MULTISPECIES: DUF1830 domain-containing protein [unclassified Synechocystis]|uniref:DUF1830 domain-containing protein n=1 Tax=unclassified Synechocystis TaxID=2640012 RepID=UPI00040E9EC4|nr:MULTISPECIES: DUF1830 domain-containing protein [unclassified Synechocystis]AIE75816.1 hypothetical protein D082_32880 [Synechocystis sp. PCC 6714]MCT0255250.1 DUF1830 domain-containing protein [Synechocystis sp. CS-94]
MSTINNFNHPLSPPNNSTHASDNRLCYYRNSGNNLQQIIINGTWKKEKLIFPGERLLFWASPQDELTVKVFQSDQISTNHINCIHLLVN